MSTWREERRLDQSAEREEARKDRKFEADMQREERKQAREDKRQSEVQRRREKAQRKQQRAGKRKQALTPANVYCKGTLALVATSAAAAIPAQVMYFVKKSLWLLPVPFALEGAAWVMAAGVAYSDERKLPGWVRWLLRGFCVTAAGFAARINYVHGVQESAVVGWGLAAVTLLGPLFFEVRQWVSTLSASAKSPKEKARATHERQRRRKFKDVAARQEQIMLAAPYGTVDPQAAFEQAWWDIKGAPVGVTAEVIEARLVAEGDVAEAVSSAERSPEQVAVEMLLADLFGPPGGDGGGVGSASTDSPGDGPRGGGAKARTALGGKGKRRIPGEAATEPQKTLAEDDLKAVRKLADALGGPHRLSARNVRQTVGCRNEYAVRLRDAIRAEIEEQQ